VGTKKQAQSIITDVSEETGMHYVNKRWLGGLLTNFPMVKKSIEKLIDLDEMKKDGRWEVKPKKEQSRMEKIYKKLYKNLWGVRNIKELPGVLIIIDSNFEEIAVFEAKKLGIPIVGIVDTNANPEGITYPVPGNDDAIRSIKLFATKFGEAVKLGLEKRMSGSLNQELLADRETPARETSTPGHVPVDKLDKKEAAGPANEKFYEDTDENAADDDFLETEDELDDDEKEL
jgi:small subunit ribosomal protein S2